MGGRDSWIVPILVFTFLDLSSSRRDHIPLNQGGMETNLNKSESEIEMPAWYPLAVMGMVILLMLLTIIAIILLFIVTIQVVLVLMVIFIRKPIELLQFVLTQVVVILEIITRTLQQLEDVFRAGNLARYPPSQYSRNDFIKEESKRRAHTYNYQSNWDYCYDDSDESGWDYCYDDFDW